MILRQGSGVLPPGDYISPQWAFLRLAFPRLEHLRGRGWQTALYQTAQMIGAAWRGNARPEPHRPDPRVAWTIPEHLRSFDLVSRPAAAGDG